MPRLVVPPSGGEGLVSQTGAKEESMLRKIRASLLVLLSCFTFVAAGPSVGWRNDGSGTFPAATPPTEWSSSKNVVWKVSLPGSSYGAPIVVGPNLFVVSDPADLLCVQRSDGK